MRTRSTFGIALAGIAVGLPAPAHAHIEYYDLNQGRQIMDLTESGKGLVGNDLPISNPAYWTSTNQIPMSSGETWTNLGGSYASGAWSYRLRVVNVDSSAWTDGLRNNPTGGANLLGDTHKLGFANFHLDRPSLVTITLTDSYAGTGFGINPSFSLYRGAAVYQTHDGSTIDPLNPRSATTPFPKIQNPKDTGSAVDSQGITSAYRNTLTNTGVYYGQFNALGGWSTGNTAGNWSAVTYIASATGNMNPSGDWTGNANSNQLANYPLAAGDYIIAFGGNAQPASYASQRSADLTSPYGTVTNLVATLTFSVTPAPAQSSNEVPMPLWSSLLAGLVLGLVGVRALQNRPRTQVRR